MCTKNKILLGLALALFTFAAPNRAQAVPFFLLSANPEGGDWYYSPYFGRYYLGYYPWIYKDCFGYVQWQGEVEAATGGGWFYDAYTRDYLWASTATFRNDLEAVPYGGVPSLYPAKQAASYTYFYSWNLKAWMQYFHPLFGCNQYRYFYNSSTRVYITYPLNVQICSTCAYE